VVLVIELAMLRRALRAETLCSTHSMA